MTTTQNEPTNRGRRRRADADRSEAAILDAATDAIRATAPNKGHPADALARMLSASWQTLGRYHALVHINSRLGPEHMHALHQPVLLLVRPLLKRGQASGAFNPDL